SGDSRIVSTKEIIKDFTVKIHKITKISNYLSEIIISAPLLAKSSSIGQIFRLQNYHTFAAKRRDQILAMEGVAVTALNVDKENGLITGIILDFGGSTSLIKNFKKGEPCIFMGPSGNATEITKDETVLLIGGGRGNMPLIAIAEEFKKNNCKIIFCAAYRQDTDITRQNEIKKVSDILIYAVEGISQNQEYQHLQDVKIQGNVTQVLQKYFAKNHHKIDRIFTIGNDKMMAEIARIRHENIIPEIAQAPIAIASLNAPMQCMMKGVCSQCLQKRQNENGEYEYFYACAVQDQNMDRIDFKHLTARCDQNSTQEKMTKLWIEYLNSIDLV
ncbi:MAG TPA: hypothetical protein VI861_01875, partial [Rickettsiales bacterium]|nr:hypothetical protein [Rickettsiales bacterium]